MSALSKILILTKQLFPQGRAFRIPAGSDAEKLHTSLSKQEAELHDDGLSIFNSILPDNDQFTATDSSDWERRLGLISSSSVSLADRKLAVARKMNHPGEIKARQHYLYLEGQLQAAGFDVYVHENRFPLYPSGYETQNPRDVYGPTGWVSNQHGQFRHGQRRHGQYYSDMVVNHIDVELDKKFKIGSNLKYTFFVGGETIGTFANVDADRRLELRQLILRIKPVQAVGYLFINYI